MKLFFKTTVTASKSAYTRQRIRQQTWLPIVGILYSLFALASCGSEEQQATQAQTDGYSMHGDTIVLTDSSNISKRLTLLTVSDQEFNAAWNTTGVVRAIPNNYAEIAAPFAGRVTRAYVKLGQQVNPGSPIFEMTSPAFFSAQKDYFDSKQEWHQADLNRKRQQDLLENGVGVQRELEEAETAYETKKSAFANASAALKIFTTNPEKMELGKPLVVTSPIQGEIVNNQLVIGQYLKEDAAALVVVAELSKIWIAGQVKEKDIHHIQAMAQVEVQVSGLPDKQRLGKIFHINEIMDEETRSVEILIECDNADRALKPGMYVTVGYKDKPAARILTPTKAIFQRENDQFVFVQVGKQKFVKRTVSTGETVGSDVVILSGLRDGEIIVHAGGVFLLKEQ